MGLKMAGISVLVLSVLGGLFYWYFSWSQSQLAEYQKTIARQESAISSLEVAVKSIKKNIANQSAELVNLDKKQSKITQTTDQLSTLLAKHDMEMLANHKPKAIEARVNAATARILSDISELTKKDTSDEN